MRDVVVLLLLTTTFAVSGCVEDHPAIVTNESAAPIRVTYVLPFFRVNVDTPQICPLQDSPPLVRPTAAERPSLDGWVAVAVLSLDVEKCEASYLLEPGFSGLLYRNGFCDDYEQHADQGAAFRPSLEYLAIEVAGRTAEWLSWDAVSRFRRAPDGWCFLRVRAGE